MRDVRGMPQWHPNMNRDQRRQKWWPAKLFKRLAWDKENASTVPGNYSLSVCIYNSHVISLSDSIIYRKCQEVGNSDYFLLLSH